MIYSNYSLLVCVILLSLASSFSASVPQQQYDALTDLYNSTHGNNWQNNDNWLTGDPCDNSWFGVICDRYYNIIALNLYDNLLKGTIPTSIVDLPRLDYLIVDHNDISDFPPNICEDSISVLSLNNNNITGHLDINDCPHLQSLFLANNNLQGSIPGNLGNFVNLEHLDMSGTKITGDIPDQIGNLYNLVTLTLNDTRLSGTIPQSFNQFPNITTLALNDCFLVGPVPDVFADMTNLEELHLENNFLSGSIPDFSESITKVYLDNNALSGSISGSMGDLLNLEVLSLSNNNLDGEVPDSIFELPNLSYCDLTSNIISDSIPSTIGDAVSLEFLSIKDNVLTGSIPSTLCDIIGGDGVDIDFSYNDLTGDIPSCLQQAPPSTDEIQLQGNCFNTPLPTWCATTYCQNSC